MNGSGVPEGAEQVADVVLDALAEFVLYLDTGMHIQWANRAALESSGMTLDALRGRPCYEVWHERTEVCPDCPVRLALESGQPREGEVVSLEKKRWSIRGYPVRNPGGEIVGAAEIAMDITGRTDAEKALRQSEDLYRSLVDASPDAIVLTDLEANLVMVNQQGARLYGVDSIEEVLSSCQSTLDLIHPDDIGMAAGHMQQTLQEGKVNSLEYRLMRKDGSSYPAEVSVSVVSGSDGSPGGFIGIIRDVTERKLADEALRESEERYRSLVETCPDGITVTDLAGNLIMANEQGARLYGCETVEELMGLDKTAFEFIVPKDQERAIENARRTLEQGNIRSIEYTLKRMDGSTYPAEISASVIRDADGQPQAFIGVIRDITERKRSEEERQKLQAQIQHAQKLESLGVLAGGIAHDFNNLLMGILGNASLAALELDEGSSASGYVEKIEKTGQHAAELTKQMLAYSGKGKFVVQSLNLSELIEDMTHLLKVSISKKVTLRYDFEHVLPPIEADATQMRQVVMNLITNASEATGDEGGVVSVATGAVDADRSYLADTYLDDALPPGRYVYLDVSDTGRGMDADTRSRIFDPFFTTKFTGRGLGLAAVLGIVRGHKGAIRVVSEPGKGSTFKVLFRASEQPVATVTRVEPPGAVARGGETILVVDDEPMVRDVARSMLESAGFRVITAENGRRGIEAFQENPGAVDAVLLDTTMPEMDGEATFRELHRITPDVRVILSSGYNQQDATTRFADKGLAGFIQKPYRLQELIDKVREILTTKR